MIIDSLKSFERYQNLHQGFEKVYNFLKKNDLHLLDTGEFQIDGNNVYCTVSEQEAIPFEKAKLEVHDSYIDIHVLLGGFETIGFKDRAKCQADSAKYDEIKDIAFLEEDEPEVYVSMGVDNFAVCFPKDAHAPLLGEGVIKKVIFKIRVNEAQLY